MKHTDALVKFNENYFTIIAETLHNPNYNGKEVPLAEIRDYLISEEEAIANGHRLAECFNAMRGIKSPAEYVEFNTARINHLNNVIKEQEKHIKFLEDLCKRLNSKIK